MRTAHWVHKASRGVRGLARFAIASPDVAPPCGCLGQVEAVQDWPPWVWLAMNALLACFAGFVACTSQALRPHESTPVGASEGAGNDAP